MSNASTVHSNSFKRWFNKKKIKSIEVLSMGMMNVNCSIIASFYTMVFPEKLHESTKNDFLKFF